MTGDGQFHVSLSETAPWVDLTACLHEAEVSEVEKRHGRRDMRVNAKFMTAGGDRPSGIVAPVLNQLYALYLNREAVRIRFGNQYQRVTFSALVRTFKKQYRKDRDIAEWEFEF